MASSPTGVRAVRTAVRLVVLHVALGGLWLGVAATGPASGYFVNDVPARFWPVAVLDAPWVQESVEFPPVAVAVLEPLGLVGQDAAVVLHVVVQLVLLLATVAVLWWCDGPRAVSRWALWATPLVPLLLLRVDLPAVLATTVALGLVGGQPRAGDGCPPPDTAREDVAGIAVAVGVLAKLWPGALVVTLWRRHRRAALVAVALTGLGTGLWMAATAVDAPVQVLGFRGATGWHMESVVGGFVRLVDGGTPALESGAWRFGDASVVPTVVLGVVALGLSLAVERRVADPARVLLTVVALGLVAAPLLSAQYAVWLLPSLALMDDLRPTEAAAAGAVVVGSVAVLWWLGEVVDATPMGWTLLLGRNGALVVLAGALVTTALRHPGPTTPPGAVVAGP